MSHKISKQDKIEFIASFLAKQGKRMTNLGKVPVTKLDEVIAKYSIDIEAMWCEKQKEKLIEEKERRDRDEKWKQEQEKRELLKTEMKKKWDKLNDAERNELYLIKFNKSYRKDPKEVELHNNIQRSHCNAMMDSFRLKGAIVSKIDDTTLCVNGVHIIIGHIEKCPTFEESLVTMSEDDQQKYTYLDNEIMEIINMKAEDIMSGETFEIEIKVKPKRNKKIV